MVRRHRYHGRYSALAPGPKAEGSNEGGRKEGKKETTFHINPEFEKCGGRNWKSDFNLRGGGWGIAWHYLWHTPQMEAKKGSSIYFQQPSRQHRPGSTNIPPGAAEPYSKSGPKQLKQGKAMI